MLSNPKEQSVNFSVGQLFESVIDWLLTHVGWFFDGLSAFVGFVVGFVEWVLVGVHPVVIIGAMALLALVVTRSLGMLVFSIIAFAFVVYANLWVQTMESLAIVVVAVAVALLIGIPLGIWAGLSNTVSAIMRPVLDVMQSMPVFVYLIPAVFFFGVGMVPGIAATIVFSIPPAVRLTELGVRGLDAELVEAAIAFGARRRTLLGEVQLPLAFSSIMAGVNQVIMLALSMVVVAGMVGAGGLGGVVVEGVSQLDAAKGFEGGIAVVILAVYLDRVTGGAKNIAEFLKNRRIRKGQEKTDAALQAAQA